jgi:hypothetical protein
MSLVGKNPETELAAVIAKLKWATAELQLVIIEDSETASDLQSVIETIQEAILQLQQ